MSTTAEALEALEQLPALRADLATAANVTAQLQAELEAERHLGEVSQAEYSQAVTHAAARIAELQDQVPGPDQMVVLKADYERLIASLPAVRSVPK